MRDKYRPHHILEVVLLFIALAGFSASNSKANENSKYLDAVREFADNVLKYGRDTYGPKHTPLFVDGLNIHTHEPVKWIAPNGDRWILSNLASQQNLFRTLDGLTKITGDPKYRQAAMEAIEYAFANLQAPNGLFYWGGGISYDAQADKQCGVGIHSLKSNYPYYKLMWEVDPRLTRKFIEAYWSTHILDWSNLAMNRGVPVDKPAGEAWNHEYKGGPVFFQSWGLSFLVAGGDLFCAAGFLGEASGDDKPLVWAKRLMHRYVETRNPGVGLSGSHFTRYTTDRAQVQLGDDFKGHLVLTGTLFPSHPEIGDSAQWERYPAFIFVTPGIRHSPAIAPWASAMLLGDMLDADGKEFTQWALEELTAWGKAAYRKKDNSFIPMLTDGTSLEGYVCKKSGDYGRKGTVFLPIPAVPMHFWTYALAYRLTGDQFMWDMARNIAHGHGLGDIGFTTESSSQLKTATDCWSPYTLLGFIELYKRTENQEFLQIARRIGDNMLDHRLHEGFFVPSDKHIYAKFDTIEHLALLHLHVALRRTFSSVPEFWPSNSLFNGPYRDRAYASDYSAIYTLTESPYPAKSAEELIASGDVEGVRLFIAQGKDINALSEGSSKTLLHWAVIKGHKDAVELLLAVKDVQIDAEDEFSSTPLYYAVEGGYKEIVELLINGGADINVKGKQGKTALFYAVENNHKDIVELLIAKGADINAKDKGGYTPLYYAIWNEDKDLPGFLINRGADVNLTAGKDYPPIYYAVWSEDLDILKLLVAKGAKFDVKVLNDRTAFHYAVSQGSKDIVEFLVSEGIDIPRLYLSACMGDLAGIKDLVEQGADINSKDELGWTPLYWAASLGQTEVAKLLIDKGADVRTAATDGGIVLYQAAQAGDNELVELLLSKGADVQAKTKWGDTPLHSAAGSGHREVAEFLIAKDADVNAKDKQGRTPLSSAASAGHSEVVKLLIAEGAEVNAKTQTNSTPLHRAAVGGHKDVVEILIAHGADVTVKDRWNRSPLDWAKQSGHTEIVKLLIDASLKENARDEEGRTILHRVASEGWTEKLHDILKNKPDVNIQDKQGLTPLHLAAAAGNKDIALLLLKHGASVNAEDKDGRTLLHFAAGVSVRGMESRSNPDLVQLLLGKGIDVDEVDSQLEKLLSAGIDVNVQDKHGVAPLHIAASAGHSNTVELLIAQGARLEIKDNAGRTALHYAAEATYAPNDPQDWSVDMVQLLIDAGADINVQDDIGWTPLHHAARKFKQYLIEVFVERGARIDIVDNRGRTPFVVMLETVEHLETFRGSAYESTISRDLRNEVREASRFLYKNGCTYVVAPYGKDTNPGTSQSPLRTITAAIEVVEPRDTIVVRGGTYACSRTIHLAKSGEPDNPIRLVAYFGETPVLDFSEAKGGSVSITGAYWHIRGLAIARAMRPIQIHGSRAHHNILEQVNAFGNVTAGICITADGPAHNIILNCDAYRNFDPQTNGDGGDGFCVVWSVGPGNTLIGNRSWNNSDDGYDCWYAGNSVRFERCYAWRNGENIWNHPFFIGNANGFKLGQGQGRHILINCVAWKHYHRGFDLNANTEGVILRNCTGWGNLINYFFKTNRAGAGNILRNNLSCEGRDSIGARVDSQYNSWDSDLGLTLTDDDFVSLDESMMTKPRNPDGSIPQNDFLKLAPHSAAIDKGADIGMSFVGAKPDLGAFEYGSNETSEGYVKMLHQAVRDRDIKKIKALLTQGEGINDKDWLGYTPLQWAVYFGYPDVVELLLSQGADPDIQSDTGRFALEIAKAMVYADIEALLRKHGAKQ